jgi:hypothetical protein
VGSQSEKNLYFGSIETFLKGFEGKKKPHRSEETKIIAVFILKTEIFVFVFNPSRNFGVVFSRTTDRLDSPVTKYM